MAEFHGTDHTIALQKQLRDRTARFQANPLLSNGGRVMNILDAEAYGWDALVEDARADGFVSATRVPLEPSLAKLRALLGPDANLVWWEVFTGPRDRVVATASQVRGARPLPEGWTAASVTHPDETTITEVQELCLATGIAPPPAYHFRGDTLPGMVSEVRDAAGALAAMALGSVRYHPEGPLAGWIFAGPVAVSPDHQGKGLGARVLADLLCDSAQTFGWTHVLAQAKAANRPSAGMIERCGLSQELGVVTIAVNIGGSLATR